MANLTDADKVLRNDTGKDIVTKLNAIKTAIENSGGGGSSTFEGLSDVDIDDQTLTNGQVPKYNSTSQKWENGDVSLVGNLDDLNDVTIDDTSLEDKQELVFNEDEGVFENKTTRVELTQAEYEQLVADDEVLPDVDYYITDAPSMQGSSKDLSYDGTTLSTHDKIEGLNATNLPIESGSATNTKSYIDSINTTLSGRNNIKYYDMSVTTVNNSYVSPFSAYKSENLPASLQSKTVLSAQVLSHSATNPTSVQFKDYTIYVYSKSAEAFDVRVVYID